MLACPPSCGKDDLEEPDWVALNRAKWSAMAGAYERLLAEIDRIVLSPYPTQLKRLRDIACAECTDLDTARWALSRPCQIECLAECLLEGLRQWPYVLELISRLCEYQHRRARHVARTGC